jgi:hypothetical protein
LSQTRSNFRVCLIKDGDEGDTERVKNTEKQRGEGIERVSTQEHRFEKDKEIKKRVQIKREEKRKKEKESQREM